MARNLNRQAAVDRRNVSLAAETPVYDLTGLKYDYEQIAEEHRERVQYATVAIRDHMGRVADSIIEAGKELLAVKEILSHGQFGDWLDTEFSLSEAMAQRMMNAARVYGANPARVRDFSGSVIYELASPSTPEEVREEILTEAEATGTPPTRRRVQEAKAARKPKPKPLPQPAAAPETPADVARAGYGIVEHDTGGYCWFVPSPTGSGGNYGVLHDTIAGAIADARAQIDRGAVLPGVGSGEAELPQGEPFATSYVGVAREPERYTVTLAAEAYHALRAAVLAGALGVYADKATVEAIKQALEEAEDG
jgi:hypothetical protein